VSGVEFLGDGVAGRSDCRAAVRYVSGLLGGRNGSLALYASRFSCVGFDSFAGPGVSEPVGLTRWRGVHRFLGYVLMLFAVGSTQAVTYVETNCCVPAIRDCTCGHVDTFL
jgi:hypothetical protein